MASASGTLRDAIVELLSSEDAAMSAKEVASGLIASGRSVSVSSVRSCLSTHTPSAFERAERGRYCLPCSVSQSSARNLRGSEFIYDKATLLHADSFEWLSQQKQRSIHAVVTDPPYGLLEYTPKEQVKLRSGKGGVWRIPPSFDGHKRSPLPRFTVLGEDHLTALHGFFERLASSLLRVCVPGANVIVASNPLLSHIVAGAMVEGGLELRGTLVRLVMTMRGGDRPKNAHEEFTDVSVMPRSQWEPWLVLRTPLEGRVQDNLRNWGTGGFRRISNIQPFGDVVKSAPTSGSERKIAPHPSLKPQAFMRQIVRGSLPLGKGVVLDPFAGAASTLAAANAVGYQSVGIEIDPEYVDVARSALPALSQFRIAEIDPILPELCDASSVKCRGSGSQLAARIPPEVRLRHIS